MNLKQIIRNQKLSNFNYKLTDFISEADEEVRYKDKENKPQTMDVSVALKQPPDHPARIAAERLRQSKEAPKKTTDDDQATATSGQDPDDKDIESIGDEWNDDGVKIDDDVRDRINDEVAGVGLSVSTSDPDAFVDADNNVIMQIGRDGSVEPGPGIDDLKRGEQNKFITAVDDINATLSGDDGTDEPMPGEEKADAEKDADAAAVDAETDTEERDAPEVTEGPMDNEQIKEELDYIEDVTGKDKRLESGANPKKSSEWTDTDIEPNPNKFKKWQKESGRSRPAKERIDMSGAITGVEQPYGFPEKYVEVLERMINTQGMADPKQDAVGNFIDGAGAGMIQSQAGEILTMMLTSIPDDEQAQAFADNIGEVLAKQSGKQILDKSWVKAAMENRTSTMDHVRTTYGPDAKINSGCWDLESEVEAMGLPDYKKNKGYSTDAYFTVETPNHPEGDLLLEVSLKKDAKVMFYNGGTGDILKPKCASGPGDPKGCAAMGWGLSEEDFEDVEHDGVTLSADSYNPAEFQRAQNRVYRENMAALTDSNQIKISLKNMNASSRNDLIRTLNDKTFKSDVEVTEDNLDKLGPKLLKGILGNYENQFDENGNKVKSSPSFATDRINKLAMLVGKNGKEWTSRGPANPPPNVNEVFKRMDKEHKDYQQNLAKGLLMNKKLRSGLMGILRDEFPIKAAATGEEIMSIGDMVLDRKTCNSLFGTANFNDIKERLSIDKDKNGNPIIVYSAQGTGDPIPLANVDIRQKGIGYSGYPSFNLKVHPGFAKALKGAQGALQEGKKKSIKYFGDILDELKQNTLGHYWMKAEEDYPVHYKQRKFKLDEYLINILT